MKRTVVLVACLLAARLALWSGRELAAARGVPPPVALAASYSRSSLKDSVEFVLEIKGDPHPFSCPADVAVGPQGDLYVMDCIDNRIQKFDSEGNFLSMWGSAGTGDGEFRFTYIDQLCSLCPFSINCLGAIAVDGQGSVYVADTINVRIQKFDSEGNFLTKWGGEGREDGQFIAPIGVATDRQSNVHVLDRNRDDVQTFDSDGRFLGRWKAYTQNSFGDLAVDDQGNVYITNWEASRVQKFDSEGNLMMKWDSRGRDSGQFMWPWGIATDGQGNLYVADGFTHRVQKFDSHGNFVTEWGSEGHGEGQFWSPYGLAVNDGSDIYVADLGNNRVQKLRQE